MASVGFRSLVETAPRRSGLHGQFVLIAVADGWDRGPQIDKGAKWEPAELGPVIKDLLAKAATPFPVHGT